MSCGLMLTQRWMGGGYGNQEGVEVVSSVDGVCIRDKGSTA